MLAPLLALVIAAPTSIDYVTIAKPLPAVLKELSELSGVEMRASKAVESDMLVIRVRDAEVAKTPRKNRGSHRRQVDRERRHLHDPARRERTSCSLQAAGRRPARLMSDEIAAMLEATNDRTAAGSCPTLSSRQAPTRGFLGRCSA